MGCSSNLVWILWSMKPTGISSFHQSIAIKITKMLNLIIKMVVKIEGQLSHNIMDLKQQLNKLKMAMWYSLLKIRAIINLVLCLMPSNLPQALIIMWTLIYLIWMRAFVEHKIIYISIILGVTKMLLKIENIAIRAVEVAAVMGFSVIVNRALNNL